MEPTFIATPYVQAHSPSSRQIRAWLDEQEVGYDQWRASRKPVKHRFASVKLNSPVKKVVAAKAEKKVSTPLWMTLSNQVAAIEANNANSPVPNNAALPSRKKSGVPIQRQRTTSFMDISTTLRPSTEPSSAAAVLNARKSSRRTTMSTPLLPSIQKGELTRQPTSNGKTVRLAVDCSASVDTLLARHVKSSALAKKKLQEHLYDFHTRQVFSFASNLEEDGENQEQDVKQHFESSQSSDQLKIVESDLIKPVSVVVPRRQSIGRVEAKPENCVLGGVSFMTSQHYARIFEHDWRLSDIDRVVRDAVERNRIYLVLKSSYRVLLWFFRFYAGKSRLANGVAHVHGLFQISSKLKLLEDLNVQCVDPSKFGITDTPLKRDGMVAFLLNVAKMMSSHSQNNPTRLRVLVAEGIEMSEAMKTLVRDHFGVYSQIQDVNHFRKVFLRKTWSNTTSSSCSNSKAKRPRRVQELLNKYTVNLENFFSERVKTPTIRETTGPSLDQQQHRQVLTMTFTQFLSTLRALGLIGNPKAAANTGATSPSAAASGPTGIEEGRALRVFLSCLKMSEFECMDSDPGVATRDATFKQFVEALLRIVLMQKELMICHGGYDVCPGELTSELCQCEPEATNYNFEAFDDAVEELFMVIHALGIKQVHKCRVMRTQSLSGAKQGPMMRVTQQRLLLAAMEGEDE